MLEGFKGPICHSPPHANVFKEGELNRDSNVQILHNTISKYKPTAICNLDVIISTRLVMNFLV